MMPTEAAVLATMVSCSLLKAGHLFWQADRNLNRAIVHQRSEVDQWLTTLGPWMDAEKTSGLSEEDRLVVREGLEFLRRDRAELARLHDRRDSLHAGLCIGGAGLAMGSLAYAALSIPQWRGPIVFNMPAFWEERDGS